MYKDFVCFQLEGEFMAWYLGASPLEYLPSFGWVYDRSVSNCERACYSIAVTLCWVHLRNCCPPIGALEKGVRIV